MSLFSFLPGEEYQFRFKNYRGEWETRHVIFRGADYGSNAYYPEPQWFIRCWDIERSESRSLVLTGIDVNTLAPVVPLVRVG
jgi:hypothetical protein